MKWCKSRWNMLIHMMMCDKQDITYSLKKTFRKTHSSDLGIYVFLHYGRFIQHKDRGLEF